MSECLGSAVRYADGDFAVLKLLDFEFFACNAGTIPMNQHPLCERLKTPGIRGTGGGSCGCLEIDPDFVGEAGEGGRSNHYPDDSRFSATGGGM